jgi:hypothetical protein
MTLRKSSDKNTMVNQLLDKMDKPIADSFTYQQRKALQKVISTRDWQNHNVDFRPTLALPFLPWNFYIVFLFGINKRGLLPAERFMATTMFLLILFFMGLFVIGCVFVILYLVKSWLGIDIFPDSSLGLWDEFKNLF